MDVEKKSKYISMLKMAIFSFSVDINEYPKAHGGFPTHGRLLSDISCPTEKLKATSIMYVIRVYLYKRFVQHYSSEL